MRLRAPAGRGRPRRSGRRLRARRLGTGRYGARRPSQRPVRCGKALSQDLLGSGKQIGAAVLEVGQRLSGDGEGTEVEFGEQEPRSGVSRSASDELAVRSDHARLAEVVDRVPTYPFDADLVRGD